jgi:phosphohistidine phosphatase
VGQLLRRLARVPDLIITSDAVRAQTTAQIAAGAAGYTGKIVLSPALYHAAPAAVVEVLNGLPQPADSVMIVGHNPGLEDLVSQLSGEEIGLATATLVQLDMPVERWSDVTLSTDARLIDLWKPADL